MHTTRSAAQTSDGPKFVVSATREIEDFFDKEEVMGYRIDFER